MGNRGTRNLISISLIGIALLGAIVPNSSFAKETPGATRANTSRDIAFLEQALQVSAQEINLANLAIAKRPDEETKALGQSVLNDQQVLRTNLVRLAEARGLKVKRSVPSNRRNVLSSLSRSSGRLFKKLFARNLVKERRELIKAFESQLRDGTDAELRALAGNTLPLLKDDFRNAMTLAQIISPDNIVSEASGAER